MQANAKTTETNASRHAAIMSEIAKLHSGQMDTFEALGGFEEKLTGVYKHIAAQWWKQGLTIGAVVSLIIGLLRFMA